MKSVCKHARKILSLALVFILVLNCGVQTFAAGEETWGYSTQLVPVGYFNFKDTNLTPVKTIDHSGTLIVAISFFKELIQAAVPLN